MHTLQAVIHSGEYSEHLRVVGCMPGIKRVMMNGQPKLLGCWVRWLVRWSVVIISCWGVATAAHTNSVSQCHVTTGDLLPLLILSRGVKRTQLPEVSMRTPSDCCFPSSQAMGVFPVIRASPKSFVSLLSTMTFWQGNGIQMVWKVSFYGSQ